MDNDVEYNKNNKDNQRETLLIEVTAWVFIIGIIYLFTKVVF